MAIPPEMFSLPAGSEATLQQQIQQVVSESIVSGRCVPGEKLPSSRKLAEHLSVARITVTLAYTELVANDYLTSRGRSGYFVSDTAPRRPTFDKVSPTTADGVDWSAKLRPIPLKREQIFRPPNWRDFKYPFIYGQSDSTLFDHRNWRACALRAVGRKDFDMLATDHYQRDDPMLVEFILRHILPRRGILANPDEILITMGSQNALWLTAQALLGQEQTAVFESPSYPGLHEVLDQVPCQKQAIKVDADGLPPEHIPPNADVVFTTPSHHCPTNVTMPIERRKAMLERAQRDDFVIVEDDYEFEVSLLNSPSPALKSLDQAGSVVYIGSFSKSLFPGLRLGYVVAAPPLIEELRSLRRVVLRHPPGHMQRTAAYFLSLGHFDAQIARLSRAYGRRRTMMEDSIRTHGLTPASDARHGGSSFWMRAPKGINTRDLALELQQKSVLIEPGAAFFAGGAPDHSHYRLAYSSIRANRIEAGVALIAEAIAAARP